MAPAALKLPPLTKLPLAVPPRTLSVPPTWTVVALSRPPWDTNSVPPSSMVLLSALVPPPDRVTTPPVLDGGAGDERLVAAGSRRAEDVRAGGRAATRDDQGAARIDGAVDHGTGRADGDRGRDTVVALAMPPLEMNCSPPTPMVSPLAMPPV